ncbi:hypothetical protein SRHO_G00266440 [Serrasalmus rhombeus]
MPASRAGWKFAVTQEAAHSTFSAFSDVLPTDIPDTYGEDQQTFQKNSLKAYHTVSSHAEYLNLSYKEEPLICFPNKTAVLLSHLREELMVVHRNPKEATVSTSPPLMVRAKDSPAIKSFVISCAGHYNLEGLAGRLCGGHALMRRGWRDEALVGGGKAKAIGPRSPCEHTM